MICAHRHTIIAVLSLALLAGCASTATSMPVAQAGGTTWIEANNTALRYELSGKGTSTIVLMHEMQMTMESFDEILPALARGHRVLRYDLRGFGLSEKIRAPITIADEEADLLALLDGLKITEPVTLIGGAVGGAVALKFAADHPERVRAVAVTSPAAYLATQPERAAGAMAGIAKPARDGADSMEAVYPAKLRTDPVRYAKFRNIVLSTDPASLAYTTQMIYTTAFKDVLPKIQCPTLIVATALFPRPVASFKELADALPHGEFVVLQTGHFASLESPEMVIPVLDGFLKSHKL